jgi:hypothetical protein
MLNLVYFSIGICTHLLMRKPEHLFKYSHIHRVSACGKWFALNPQRMKKTERKDSDVVSIVGCQSEAGHHRRNRNQK